MSIFCVALTQFLKINLVLQGMNFSNRTLNYFEHNNIKRVINNELISSSNQRRNSSHNQSMQEQIGRNLNISYLPRNSCSNVKSSGEENVELYLITGYLHQSCKEHD